MPIYVVLSGLPHFASVIEYKDENDVQVIRRFRFWQLPDLDLSIERNIISETIATAAATASLTPNFRSDSDLIDRLCHAALRQFGLGVELINEAVETALIAGDQELSIAHFVQSYSERTGSALIANPFAVTNWLDVDCRAVLVTKYKEQGVVAKGTLTRPANETRPW